MMPNHNKSVTLSEPEVSLAETDVEEIPEDLRHLPRDVGWILLISGLMTEFGIPGIPPFWIAGIMVLWPETGYRLTRPLQKRFPRAYKQSIKMVSRFVSDLDRRYPPKKADD